MTDSIHPHQTMNHLFTAGRILSPLYSTIMSLRADMYAKNVLKSVKLPMPVICVGNLTLGGTGKTPMVMYIAKLLSGEMKPAVISRGYGGRLKGPVNVISDGENIFFNSFHAGDEPILLAESLPGVPVVTGAKRIETGRYLVENKMADVLIMDDGFQHLALKRDLNLALFSASSLIGNGCVFPGGILREPIAALDRADCFVISGVEDSNRESVEAFVSRLLGEFPHTPLFKGCYEPFGLKRDGDEQVYPLSKLKEVPLYAFCGIANPQSFHDVLTKHFLLKGWKSFKDHHRFCGTELFSLSEEAFALGCKGLIVTEKDFVKIKGAALPLPLWIVQVRLKMENGFDQFVRNRVKERV